MSDEKLRPCRACEDAAKLAETHARVWKADGFPRAALALANLAAGLRADCRHSDPQGWVSVNERLPDIPNPVCYFPAGAMFRDDAHTVQVIQWPGHWKDKSDRVPFTHWRTVESLAPAEKG